MPELISTEDNLKAAIEDAVRRYTEVYPGFARTARDEGFDDTADLFERLARAEKANVSHLTRGLEQLG
ncbi:MAG TPA: ferritin family protein [Acidimicrobiales bacterium]|nr:ferritin family protein [Acidimicrobiales bacterium]